MTVAEQTVFLVDDEQPVLTSVSRVLRAAGFRTAMFDSARRFLETYASAAPGCLVLDFAMPGLDGLQVQEQLAQRGMRLPVIFLTGRADVPGTVRAMKGGAADFLTKPVDDVLLIDVVTRALKKDRALQREWADRVDAQRRLETLTPRELEVMMQVVAGRLNKQAAAELGAAEKTIKVHRARVMTKMGAASVAELVRLAQAAGVDASS